MSGVTLCAGVGVGVGVSVGVALGTALSVGDGVGEAVDTVFAVDPHADSKAAPNATTAKRPPTAHARREFDAAA